MMPTAHASGVVNADMIDWVLREWNPPEPTLVRITEDWHRNYRAGNWYSEPHYVLHYADGTAIEADAIREDNRHLVERRPVRVSPKVELTDAEMNRVRTVADALDHARTSRRYAGWTIDPLRSFHLANARLWLAWARGLRRMQGTTEGCIDLEMKPTLRQHGAIGIVTATLSDDDVRELVESA